MVVGQNPGTNHPAHAVRPRGGQAPRREDRRGQPAAGGGPDALQEPAEGPRPAGHGTKLADRFLPVRVNGDLALFAGREQGAARAGGRARRAPCSTTRSSPRTPPGSTRPRRPGARSTGRRLEELSGLSREQIEAFTDDVTAAGSVIVCWAMGLTQHKNAVETIREVDELPAAAGQHRAARARGRARSAGTATCRATGRWASGRRCRTRSSTSCATSSASSRRARTAGTWSTRSGRCATGKVDVFFALGGNFAAATPDTEVTTAGARPLRAHRARLDQAEPLARAAPAARP